MASITDTKITYRKTKDGQWVAFGPLSAFKETVQTPEGPDTVTKASVVVTKKNGEAKTEQIARLGKPFDVQGVPHVYGYIAKSAPRARRRYHDDDFCGCPGANGIDMCLTCGHSPC